AFGLRLARVPEHHELARLHLFAAEEANRPRDEEDITALDRAVEERLPRPRALDVPARIADHRLEDAQTGTCREHALAHDLADHRRVLADLHGSRTRDGARVFVPAWQVEEQVARCVH